MAARLITLHASNAEIATLRAMFTIFESDQISARIDEYSEMNIRFHQAIIGLSRCDLLAQIAANLFIHMRAIRAHGRPSCRESVGTYVLIYVGAVSCKNKQQKYNT